MAWLYIISTAQYHRFVSPDFPARSWWRSFEARLLLGALFIRLLYLATILDNPYFTVPITDEAMYDTWARAIVAGENFTGNYPYFDSPLHAYYLAAIYWLFGHNLLAVRIIQVIIGTVNVFVLYQIARRLFGEPTAKVAGLLAATYLPFLYFEGLLLKESVALFLLNATLLLLLGALTRPTGLAFWAVGVVLGLLALSRVNALALIPVLLVITWTHQNHVARLNRIASVSALLLGLSMVIAPVSIRNLLASGEWVTVSVAGGQLLYTANNPANTTGDLAPTTFVRASPFFERIDFHRRAEAETGRHMTPNEVSAYWRRQSLDFALAHPDTQARMIGHRLLRFWNWREMPDNHSYDQFKQLSWVLRTPLPGYWLVAPFALVGLVLLRARWKKLSLVYGALGFYLMSLLPFWVSARYRLPIVGVVILFAAAAMVDIRRKVLADYGRAWLKPAVGLGIASLVCWLPLNAPSSGPSERNLAFAYELSGHYGEAAAIYERLWKTEHSPDDELALANVLGLAGRSAEATAILERLSAPTQAPTIRLRAFNYLGDLARREDRWPAAEHAYRSALALDAREYLVWNSLAIILANQDRFDEAEHAFKQAAQLAPEGFPANQIFAELERRRVQQTRSKSP